MITRFSLVLGLLTGLVLMALVGLPQVRAAGETAFQVQLVWGTNGEKPQDKPLKDVDSKLQDKLKGIFKWRNYYEVTSKPLSLPKEGSQKLRLSDKCVIEGQDLGGNRFEIRLYGEGKLLVKRAQAVDSGEVVVLAGDSKNDTAWFVVVTRGR